MSTMASQITSLTIVYSTVYSDADQKLRVTGLCEGNSPVIGGFPAQRVSNATNIFIWWRHHVLLGDHVYKTAVMAHGCLMTNTNESYNI